MKDLVDLVRYVNPQRLKRLRFFFRSKRLRDQTHAGRLYQALVEGKDWNDEKASKELFGAAQSSHYYKVKHELRQELLNSVLLVDSGQKSRGYYYAGYLRCRKELYAADVLWVEGHIRASMSVLTKLLPIAEELELPEIILPTLQHLRNYYIVYVPDRKRYNELKELVRKWTEVREAAERINELFEEVAISYTTTAAAPEGRFDWLVQELDKTLETNPPVILANNIYQACIIRNAAADSNGNYDQTFENCWNCLEELDAKKHVARSHYRNIYTQIIATSIKTRSMFHGQKAVIQALKLVDEGDPPWFRINQLFFYLCLRSEDYGRAIELCNRIFNHSAFKKQSQLTKERWRLMLAYLSWLVTVSHENKNNDALGDFKLAKFLNSVPEFTKDKMGLNVPVLVIQVLWLLQKGKYLDVRGRLESLKRYASRHLAKSPGTARTYYFIRLLSQLDNANFKKSVFIDKAQPFLIKLSGSTAKEDLQSVEVEIVPYEKLYQEMLGLLNEQIK